MNLLSMKFAVNPKFIIGHYRYFGNHSGFYFHYFIVEWLI